MRLSDIQRDVLIEAQDGSSLAEIGERLGLPRTTVSARLSDAYKALDVHTMQVRRRIDRREIAYGVAVKNGLISHSTGV